MKNAILNPKTSRPPSPFHIPLPRRRLLKALAAASAGFSLPGYLAEALTLSPTVTQGPYYPLASNIPLDKDNDLVRLNDQLTLATGLITWISGRVLTASGSPVRNALVELWHADHEGDYLYSASASRNPACDSNFAGFGQFLTGSDGAFLFRTIKAGLYVGRTRHFHWGVTLPGQLTRATSQTFWNETALGLDGRAWATQNSNDNVFSTVSNADQRASVLLDFKPIADAPAGDVAATWDYVSGLTPTDPAYPGGSLIVEGEPVAGPTVASPRYRLRFKAYAGYTYEIYGNPTIGALGGSSLPFALSASAAIDRTLYTAPSDTTLDLFVNQSSVRGFYFVAFRVPGANTGTPGSAGGGGGGPRP